ncbi:MAG: sigma-70 family RNA polymerase sigma factor [Nannocystaceae bacterium]
MDDTPALTDCQLLEALASGDASALGVLYDRYAPLMLAVAIRILGNRRESEDLVHDVLVEAWRKSATYSQKRGSVRTWLFVRLRSRALDRIRRSARHPVDPLKDLGADPRPEASPIRNTEYARVREAIATLPEAQRKVLELAYFGGLSSREVAQALGIPVGTVKSRTAAGLHKLRAAMKTLATSGGNQNG